MHVVVQLLFFNFLCTAVFVLSTCNVQPLKEEVSRKFAVISKPKKCLSVSRNNEIIVKFVINYHPSAIELLIGASGQRQSRPVWIET